MILYKQNIKLSQHPATLYHSFFSLSSSSYLYGSFRLHHHKRYYYLRFSLLVLLFSLVFFADLFKKRIAPFFSIYKYNDDGAYRQYIVSISWIERENTFLYYITHCFCVVRIRAYEGEKR